MTPKQALSKAKKLFGKNAAVSWRPDLPDAEGKAEHREKWLAAKEKFEAAKLALDARRKELLEGDTEYRRLLHFYNVHREAMDKHRGFTVCDRAQIGTCNGIGFFVKAGGDTFDECFRKAGAGA